MHGEAGKGDTYRPVNHKTWSEKWDKAFGGEPGAPPLSVHAVENAVFRWPEGLEGWRMFRLEYGGHAESCKWETHIFVPPWIGPDEIEALFIRPQQEKSNVSTD